MLPMGITVLDLSAYAGLVAVGAVTLNMLLGLLMACRYSPPRSWPHRRFSYFRFHNWTGYIALAVSFLHPVILLFNKNPRFCILDLGCPVHSPASPSTTPSRHCSLSARICRCHFLLAHPSGPPSLEVFHFFIYFAAAALFWHSLFTDPALKNAPVDWSDGGKLFVESCLLLIAAISLLRLRHARKSPTRQPNRSADSQRQVSITVKKALPQGWSLLIYLPVSRMEPA